VELPSSQPQPATRFTVQAGGKQAQCPWGNHNACQSSSSSTTNPFMGEIKCRNLVTLKDTREAYANTWMHCYAACVAQPCTTLHTPACLLVQCILSSMHLCMGDHSQRYSHMFVKHLRANVLSKNCGGLLSFSTSRISTATSHIFWGRWICKDRLQRVPLSLFL
jgi:hypothetical protein